MLHVSCVPQSQCVVISSNHGLLEACFCSPLQLVAALTALRLSLVVGNSEISSPKFDQLMMDIPQKKASTKIGGRATGTKTGNRVVRSPLT